VDLLRDQAGVIARRQALEAGLTDNDIRRRLRRREWVSVHPGVYVDHTGPLTWLQRVGRRVVRMARVPVRRVGDASRRRTGTEA
jgi:hypothetical protein